LKTVFTNTCSDLKVTTNQIHFSEIINNNKVAIIGPSCADLLDVGLLEELNDYDVIVLINGFGSHEFSRQFQGSKKIVSYYNSYHAKMVYIDPGVTLGGGIDFSIYREYKYKYQVDQTIKGCARLVYNNHNFFNGVPQALQTILHDLSCFYPKEVKAFGFDLYTSKKLYNNNYATPQHRILYDIARHDPISNFNYTKSLFESGFFKADNVLTIVLEMDISQYLIKIEKSLN
jgi:hypothetical protein